MSLRRKMMATRPANGYSAEVLADSPIGYWRLDETSGTLLADSSGNGRHGTYIGNPSLGNPGAVAGGTAPLLVNNGGNGTGQYGVVPHHASLDPSGAFTLECWVNPVSYQSQSGLIYKFSNGTRAWDWKMVGGGVNSIIIQINDTTAGPTASCSTEAPLGVWTHLVVVFTPNTNVRFYVNGIFTNQVSYPHSMFAGTSEVRLGFGWSPTAPSAYGLNGFIDECAIYPSALSADRIAAHYAARNAP